MRGCHSQPHLIFASTRTSSKMTGLQSTNFRNQLIFLLSLTIPVLAFEAHANLSSLCPSRHTSDRCHDNSFKLIDRNVRHGFLSTSLLAASRSFNKNCSPNRQKFNRHSRNRRRAFFNVSIYNDIGELLQAAEKDASELDEQAIAAVWSRIPRLLSKWQTRPIRDEEIFLRISAIFEHTNKSIETMRLKEITTIILAMAKIVQNIKRAKQLRHLNRYQQAFDHFLLSGGSTPRVSIFSPYAETANRLLVEFDARCISNLAYAYALLGYDPNLEDGNTLLSNIADASIGCIHKFEPQGISNIVWAFATLKLHTSRLFQSIDDALDEMTDLNGFEPQDFSNILWAYAKVDMSYSKLFDKVGGTIVNLDNLNSFKPQELSNIVWAYAKISASHPGLFDKVADTIVYKDNLDSFKPQTLSNIVWAYATCNIQNADLFDKVADAVVDMKSLDSFKPQALSNIVWAYAKADVRHFGLFEKIANAILDEASINMFNSQALSNIVWAYATVNIEHPRLFEKVGNVIVDNLCNLDSFKPQNLANIVWAYATANVHHHGVFNKVGNVIASMISLGSFESQELSNTVWAYATCNIEHRALFDRISNAVIGRKTLDSFKPQELSNLVWSYAATNEFRPDLFDKIGSEIVRNRNIDSFNMQELANIAWSYAVADIDNPLLFSDDFVKVISGTEDELNNQDLCQLYQWHLWQTREKLNSNTGLSEQLYDRCYRAFISSDTRTSAFQKDVTSELVSIGIMPLVEHVTESGYSIDSLFKIDSKRVGIEIDGPSHFIGLKQNGATALKHRQATSIDNIFIVHVPYWEWEKFGNNRKQKQQYLRSLLNSSITEISLK